MTGVRSQRASELYSGALFAFYMEVQMENSEIIYTTVEEQIEKLKEQHLIIQDEDFAKSQLKLYGYFNLIKNYREPYIVNIDNKKVYRSGVTFEQICSLYILDKNLRNAVMASMLDLEEHVKAVTADIIGNSFGIHQDQYLQFKNYRDKKRKKSRFSLAGILQKMRDAMDTDKNPVYHYRQCHGIIPPWVLFKNIYFSTIVNYISLFKTREQELVASSLYDTNSINLPLDELRKLMMDTLFICLEYRNLAAHGGRTYNYICNSNLRILQSPDSRLNAEDLHGFSQLLILLKAINYQSPFEHLRQMIETEVNRHCSRFPQDVTYLGQILNMNIVPTHSVWITENSNKYHSVQHCSGIKNAIELDIEEAIHHGYIPCKKCNK